MTCSACKAGSATSCVAVLICYMAQDLTWIAHLARKLWFATADYRPYLFLLRITWGCFAIQYQALALFLEALVSQKQALTIRQKLFSLISLFFFIFALLLALFNSQCMSPDERPALEFYMRNLESYYALLIVMIPSLLLTFYKALYTPIPRILKKQIKLLLPGLIIPMWISDLLQLYPVAFSPHWATNSYSAVGISTLLLTYAVYYCTRKIISFRFLNFRSHVQSLNDFQFIDGFKQVLEQLSHAASYAEIGHIAQSLFKQAFEIPVNKTSFYVRKVDTAKQPEIINGQHRTVSLIEGFLTQTGELEQQLKEHKILIYDEVKFTYFYEHMPVNRTLLHFLDTIHADIFLPIYEKNQIIAYLIVDRYAQPDKFYGDVERDEMLVFASYLGNIINLLQTRNLKQLLAQEKELKEELYHKHQEITQYKESIRSFLRTSSQKDIGVIFYKNRQFTYNNKAAKDLMVINVNIQHGHPLAKAVRHIAKQVQEFKSSQSCLTYDTAGGKLIITGVLSLEHNHVIITVYRPEITDLIKKQIDALKDPTKWDYLLYLETTRSGKLINQLIPSTGETLLNFKVHLLQLALSSKAILLHMPEEDVRATVEIIHHISLREQLHVLVLSEPVKNHLLAAQLFGINELFGKPNQEPPLFEQLSERGTLFIQHIELLDLETQEYLAEYLNYGFYRRFKSEQRLSSQVRIICSTNQNLHDLMHKGSFSPELFAQLKETSLLMPSLLTLPEHELAELIDGLAQQTLPTTDLHNLLELTDKEKAALNHKRPISLHELRHKIQQLLVKKSKEHQIHQETQFDPAYQLADPHLIEAARLGRHALRDPRILAMLWHKFKSQSKIATFLGVNRSSVNRRCKDYNLS